MPYSAKHCPLTLVWSIAHEVSMIVWLTLMGHSPVNCENRPCSMYTYKVFAGSSEYCSLPHRLGDCSRKSLYCPSIPWKILQPYLHNMILINRWQFFNDQLKLRRSFNFMTRKAGLIFLINFTLIRKKKRL